MLTSELRTSLVSIAFVAVMATAGQAFAQDAEPQRKSPWALFNFGFSAYQKGNKEQALQAYRDASEQGQIGATWKLGRMYAEGDGVTQDDYEAYKYFSEVVRRGVEPGSREETFVGDAYAELGRYAAVGIPGTPVQQDLTLAQEYYARAATYGSAVGQFELGREYLEQSKEQPGRLTLAARWLKLAARNGHEGARAILGDLLFRSGKVVDGLAMMTAALERAAPSDRAWIQPLQEEAFAVTDEQVRREAIEQAGRMLNRQRSTTAERSN